MQCHKCGHLVEFVTLSIPGPGSGDRVAWECSGCLNIFCGKCSTEATLSRGTGGIQNRLSNPICPLCENSLRLAKRTENKNADKYVKPMPFKVGIGCGFILAFVGLIVAAKFDINILVGVAVGAVLGFIIGAVIGSK